MSLLAVLQVLENAVVRLMKMKKMMVMVVVLMSGRGETRTVMESRVDMVSLMLAAYDHASVKNMMLTVKLIFFM